MFFVETKYKLERICNSINSFQGFKCVIYYLWQTNSEDVLEKKLFNSISYYECGSGEPLVLLHGYFCSSLIFEPIIGELSKKYQVIVPDLPGYGDSVPIQKGTHVDDFANALLPLINEVCPGKFFLYGHSMGGYIALSLAEKIPGKIYALGLICVTAKEVSQKRKKVKEREKYFIEQGKLELLVRNSIPSSFLAENREDNAEIIQKIIAEAFHLTPLVIDYSIDAIVSRPNRLSFLKNAGFKVIYLVGMHDSFNNAENLIKEAHEIEGVQIELFFRSGHFCFLEEKHKFICCLLENEIG